MSPHARFLAWFAAAAALFAAPLALNYAVIVRSGELEPLEQVAAELERDGAIYGSGLHDTRAELPLTLIRRHAPEVMALGSSRPYDFRSEYFTRPFACACGTMDSIEDGESFADLVLQTARPKLVLLAADFWWFTVREPHRRSPINLETTAQLTRAKLLRPFEWLREGTITPRDYLRLLGGSRDLHGVIRRPKIGVMAIKRGIGVRADGTILHGVRLIPEGLKFYAPIRYPLVEPMKYVMTEPRRRGEHSRFGPDNVVVPERLAALDRVVAKFRAAGAHVIVFLPPVAPGIARAMAESGRHGFMQDLDRQLRSRGFEYYNFHDPSALGADACEFSDAYHSGNVVFMRMLRAMLQMNPSSPLAAYVDRAMLDDGIRRFAGRTIAGFGADAGLPPELDYLQLGCKRP